MQVWEVEELNHRLGHRIRSRFEVEVQEVWVADKWEIGKVKNRMRIHHQSRYFEEEAEFEEEVVKERQNQSPSNLHQNRCWMVVVADDAEEEVVKLLKILRIP